MSDTKPVEEPVAPVVATETPAPAVEAVPETKVEEPVAEAPAAAEPAATEEAAPVAEEVKPVEEGILGYKGPSLLSKFVFSKKFFWFGSEPFEEKHLSSYLRGEKEHGNAAWAQHTGKGLLLFSKKSSEKATPAGIINLSDASEVSKQGLDVFYFTADGHKHSFETASAAERDAWVAALTTKIAEAKELAPTVKESESYKSAFEKLSKPVATPVVAKVEAKKEEKAEKKEEKKEVKEEKKEEKAEAKEEKKEEKKERKSRSASRKRNSIFGGFGKKTEPKEETAAEAPATEPVVAEPAVAETAPVAEAAVATEPVAPVVEEPASPVEAKPANSKRNSIFGTLKSRISQSKPEKKEETAPEVPAKDAEPVSETAPVIPAVESTEPLAASVVSPATAPVETTEAPVTNGETKTETPAAKSDKRKSSLGWIKSEKAEKSGDESEKPASPLFAKIRKTFKGKNPKSEKLSEKATEPAAETAAPEVEAVKPAEEPVVSEPTPVINNASPQVSATA